MFVDIQNSTFMKTKYFISCWQLLKFMTFTYSFFWSIALATISDEEIVLLIEFSQQILYRTTRIYFAELNS